MKINNVANDHISLAGVLPNQHQPMAMGTLGRSTFSSYIIPGWNVTSYGSGVIQANELEYTLTYVPQAMSFDRISVQVTISGLAGKVMRLGIYDASVNAESMLQPNALILDAGVVAIDSAGIKEININQSLEPGYYFLASLSNDAVTVIKVDHTSPHSLPLSSSQASMVTATNKYIAKVGEDPVNPFSNPALAPNSNPSSAYATAVRLRVQ